MFWKLLGKITPNLRSGRELFGSIKSPLFISRHTESSLKLNESVEKWIVTLPEDKQKRIRHIQNEVGTLALFTHYFAQIIIFHSGFYVKLALRIAEGKRVPKLDVMQIENYEEMLFMSNSRRNRYYDYIRSISTAETSEDVNKHVESFE